MIVDLFMQLLEDALFSAVPAIGFAMVFNVPPHALPYCGAAGALAHSFRTLLMFFGVSIELATFAASTLVGVMGWYWSDRKVIPVPVFTVAAIIPMIPGVYAFSTMIALVEINLEETVSQELVNSVVSNGLKTIFVIGAISFGLAIPKMLLKNSKPVV